VSERRRLLAVDLGSVRIGLAVSDADRKIASPLVTYERTDAQRDARFIAELAEREEIARIVVGLPIHAGGEEGKKAAEAREYGKWLEEVTGLPVTYFDERYTTVEAEEVLWTAGLTHKQRKKRRDQLAAQIILQGYLDAGGEKTEG
jgi:putative Holliday junction resolvase